MLKFLRLTFLWVLLLPYLIGNLGAASNQLVLVANHDKFPVMYNEVLTAEFHAINAEKIKFFESVPEDSDKKPLARVMEATIKAADAAGIVDERHCLMTSKTHLNFLSDVFDFHDGIYSIGDGFLYLAGWLDTFCPFVWVALILMRIKELKR